ncbi:MAG: hypothetical protein AB1Z98_20920 [Nannocystaceae bacterium]
MDHERRTAIARDLTTFKQRIEQTEPLLDLEPDIAEYIGLAREVAFRSGWDAGQTWETHRLAEAPTVPSLPRATVRMLVDIGDRAWTQPLAVIEHIPTGDRFVDPRFPIELRPSERSPVELLVTEAGLVATGPADLHRLCPEIDRDSFRPLADFRPATSG